MAGMSVAQALEAARRLGVTRLDAQLLLAHHLQQPRTWLLAHDDFEFDAPALHADIARRAAGTPLAYLVGEREFHGLMLQVTPAVLVPRPDTELLVDWALELLATLPQAVEVADLGTGSGAVALAIKHAWPHVRLTATDRSADALAVASANAKRLRLVVEFVAGDWWAPLRGRCFDLVVSNPPYIAAGDSHLEALVHEPMQALTPGGDGLAALRDVVEGAPLHLRAGGWLLLEHGQDQALAVQSMLADAGFEAARTRSDLAALPRVTGARWPG